MHIRSKSVLRIATLVGILTAAVAVVWAMTKPATPAPGAASVLPVEGLVTSVGFAPLGSMDAKVSVIEFSDFECPYCGKYARETYPELYKQLIAKGTIRYSFRNYPLENIHRTALKASEAVACADKQGRFWQLHDILFRNQHQLEEEHLSRFAEEAGLESTSFKACLNGGTTERIRADKAEAERLGIRSTPQFLIGVNLPDGTIKVLRRVRGDQRINIFLLAVDDVRRQV